jgi:hypothetical protein
MSKTMDFLVILFSQPGPKDTDVEIRQILALLKQEEDVTPSPGCKVKTSVEPVGDVSDLGLLKASMIHLLRTDTENPLYYDITTTGFYAKEYAFFQVAYAVLKAASSRKAADEEMADINAVFQSAIEGVEREEQGEAAKTNKHARKGWQFWR